MANFSATKIAIPLQKQLQADLQAGPDPISGCHWMLKPAPNGQFQPRDDIKWLERRR